MELKDVVKTFELENKHRDHLNGFLKIGWRIFVTLKERVTDGGGAFDDQIKYVLGTDNKDLKLGASYQEMLQNMKDLKL